MRREEIAIPIEVFGYNELEEGVDELVVAAKAAAEKAYAPYSNFRVGAAVRMASGKVVTGSNQENAAYPSGLCAERTALFHAGAYYPDEAVQALAVVALRPDGAVAKSAAPCGGCRQVILESADRHHTTFPVYLIGPEEVTKVADCHNLLPIAFDSSAL